MRQRGGGILRLLSLALLLAVVSGEAAKAQSRMVEGTVVGREGSQAAVPLVGVAVVVKGEERLPIRQHKAGCFSGAIKRTGSCTAKGLFCIVKGSFRHCRTTL